MATQSTPLEQVKSIKQVLEQEVLVSHWRSPRHSTQFPWGEQKGVFGVLEQSESAEHSKQVPEETSHLNIKLKWSIPFFYRCLPHSLTAAVNGSSGALTEILFESVIPFANSVTVGICSTIRIRVCQKSQTTFVAHTTETKRHFFGTILALKAFCARP